MVARSVMYRDLLLEVLDVVDRPVGLGECGSILSNISLAGFESGLLSATGRSPSGTCPVSAERSVKDGDLVVEKVARRASRSAPAGKRLLPGPWHRLVGSKIRRNGGTREEPDGNARVDPLHSVNASLCRVEASAVRVLASDICKATSGVARSRRAAVGVHELTRGRVGRVADCGTALAGVERGGVRVRVVHTLKDVNLTACRPVGSI